MKKEEIDRIDRATATFSDNHMTKILKYKEVEILEKMSRSLDRIEKSMLEIWRQLQLTTT